MTRAGRETVKLSFQDWIAILGVVVVLGGAGAAAYLRHDRMLSEIGAAQRSNSGRIDRIEFNPTVAEIDARLRNVEATRYTDADALRLEQRIDKRLDEVSASLRRIESHILDSK